MQKKAGINFSEDTEDDTKPASEDEETSKELDGGEEKLDEELDDGVEGDVSEE